MYTSLKKASNSTNFKTEKHKPKTYKLKLLDNFSKIIEISDKVWKEKNKYWSQK